MKYGWSVSFLIAFGLVAACPPANADDFSKIRIVRLSFIEGDVQFSRPGEDWKDARLNLPIEEGFKLRTAEGYAEVEFEDAVTLRLGTNATVEFSELSLQNGGRITKLTVPEGTAILSAKLKRGDSVSVTAPGLSLTVPHDSRFRIDVGADQSFVSVFHGKVEVGSDAGTPSSLNGGHTLRIDPSGASSRQVAANPPQDDFDKWVAHRDDALNASESQTASLLSMNSYTMGFSDLYDYGVWSDVPGFGMGWMPYGAGMGWMPFMSGQWQFMGGGLGWNWISAEPWGWLPYHYGSWVNAPGVGWAWLPVGSPVWSPATARWVSLNGQLGWVPTGPTLSSKPSKTQLAALPSTAVLASQGTTGTISPGTRLSLAQSGMKVVAASAPAASFGATATASPSASLRAGASGNSNVTVRPTMSAPVGPSSLRAPSASAAPRALTAPRASPTPMIARGAAMPGFGALGTRTRGSGTVGTGSVSRGTSAPASMGASHSAPLSGSSGSSSSHH